MDTTNLEKVIPMAGRLMTSPIMVLSLNAHMSLAYLMNGTPPRIQNLSRSSSLSPMFSFSVCPLLRQPATSSTRKHWLYFPHMLL
jgi:hypothetical protein